MKCLTLTQPYATLIAIGAKKIETRSWITSYRGPLAIHAAQGLASVGGRRGLRDLVMTQPFFAALRDYMMQHEAGYYNSDALPLGAIVATCELQSVIRIETLESYVNHDLFTMTDQERAFGDYSPGRYAWLLADVQALPEPIPCKGALGLWEPDTLTQMAIKRQQIQAAGR